MGCSPFGLNKMWESEQNRVFFYSSIILAQYPLKESKLLKKFDIQEWFFGRLLVGNTGNMSCASEMVGLRIHLFT